MAYFAVKKFTADGSTTNYAISFPYLANAHVEVRVAGVLKATPADYTIVGATVVFGVAPLSGLLIELRRNSSQSARIVTFNDGSNLPAADLNKDGTQDFYISQEAMDKSADVFGLDSTNSWDAQSHRIKNVSDPINPQDAATQAYGEANWGGVAATAAAASASAASASETAAAGSASAASTSETNASASATSASTSAATATGAATAASTSAGAASTSETNAAASASAASTSETNAAASASAASTSETNAAASASAASSDELLAKDWATKLLTTVDGTDFSAKYEAQAAAASAGAASTSETNAAASASAASSSATAASGSATSASGSATAASTSAGAASTSETNAAASASAASTSETNAAASASAASSDELLAKDWATKLVTTVDGTDFSAKYEAQAAAASASAASSSASAASTSETNAASSASAASTSAGAASTSETNAAASAASAVNSANAASVSESNAYAGWLSMDEKYLGEKTADPTLDNQGSPLVTGATYWNTTAGDYRIYTGSAWVAPATQAAASASAASTSETNAAGSASAASTSATNASGSASAASTSATNAGTSATNASNSASAASTSATNAATSETNTNNKYIQFDDRYLGVKSADPTLDNYGGALVQGALYFSSVDLVMKAYDGSVWNAISSSGGGATTVVTQASHGFVVGNVLYFTGSLYAKASAATAATAEVLGIVASVADANTFTLLHVGSITGLTGLTAGSVYFLDPTTAGAMTVTEPTTPDQISKPLLVATSTTDGIFFNMRGEVVGVRSVNMAREYHSGDASTTGFALGYTPASQNAIFVSISGVDQRPVTDYTVSGSTLTFVTAPPSGTDNITVIYVGDMVAIGTPSDGTVTPAKLALTTVENVLAADVLLNSTTTFFDGPSVAQGTVGTWLVTASVTLVDTAGTGTTVAFKLHDGTTVFRSGQVTLQSANRPMVVTLSAVVTSPAGNLRMSAKDVTTTTGKMAFNNSGLSKDCSITAVRIG